MFFGFPPYHQGASLLCDVSQDSHTLLPDASGHGNSLGFFVSTAGHSPATTYDRQRKNHTCRGDLRVPDQEMASWMPHTTATAVHLDAPTGAYSAIPCWWTRRSWLKAVRAALGRHYVVSIRDTLKALTGGGITIDTVMIVAEAMADFAESGTGRHCRPAVATLCAATGCSRRVVQRARRVLEMLGVARITVDGRVRTRAERMESWRRGDRSRGWATEYALSIPATLSELQSVDRGTPSLRANRRKKNTGNPLSTRRKSAVKRKSSTCPGSAAPAYGQAVRLAYRWAARLSCPDAIALEPKLAARALCEAVEAGWSVDDLDEAVAQHRAATGLTPTPANPGGWLRWLIRQHDQRPTEARKRRIAARESERAEKQAQRAAERAELERNRATPERMETYRARWRARPGRAESTDQRPAEQTATPPVPTPRRGGWRAIVERRRQRTMSS